MTPQTIDVTGLPEPVVQHLRALVDSIRGDTPAVPRWDAPLTTEQLAERERIRLAVLAAARPSVAPLSAEEWIAAWKAWGDAHAVPGVVVDDSRESFYEGRE
jgi:hypothetical protein